jgi:hypothetical protein
MNAIRLYSCIVLCAFASLAHAQMTPTHRTTSDGRPLASSLPAKAAGTRAQPVPISFNELSRHIDARVIITTEYGDRKEGRIDSVSGSTLRLKTSAGIGYAVTNFERSHIRSITLLP